MIVSQILQQGIGGFFNTVKNASTNVLNQGFSLIRHAFAVITGHVDALIAQIRSWIEGNKIAAIVIAAAGVITVPIVLPLIWAPAKAIAGVIGRVLAGIIKIPAALVRRIFRWISARTTMS